MSAERDTDLVAAGAATVYEAAGRRGALDPGIVAFSAAAAVGGRAVPVGCHPGDNLAIHRAVAEAGEGDVLVIDGAAVMVGYLGDILAQAAQERGVSGAVIDGGARDLEALRDLGFPVWARGPAIPGASKVVPGRIGEPIVCGGVQVAWGDLVVADVDGVVAVPAAEVETVAAAVARRLAFEEDVRAGLARGETTLDLLDLRAPLR
jgi:4-hydroxy-4-methyl-2-oxoglutarate aldolase